MGTYTHVYIYIYNSNRWAWHVMAVNTVSIDGSLTWVHLFFKTIIPGLSNATGKSLLLSLGFSLANHGDAVAISSLMNGDWYKTRMDGVHFCGSSGGLDWSSSQSASRKNAQFGWVALVRQVLGIAPTSVVGLKHFDEVSLSHWHHGRAGCVEVPDRIPWRPSVMPPSTDSKNALLTNKCNQISQLQTIWNQTTPFPFLVGRDQFWLS